MTKQEATIKKEVDAVLEKHGYQVATTLSFPKYNILPDDVQLALKVFENHGGMVKTIYLKKSEKK